ncbi:MAG: NAD(P)-binding domain-containing protein [Nanoarchaeota archaeon]|nr:NAD(P)-binding domain-containing protein [Nanoarchaeota archaeon]
MAFRTRIGFLGAGNIAEAMIGRLYTDSSFDVAASRRDAAKLEELGKKYGVETYSSNRGLVERSDVVVLGIEPSSLAAVLKEVHGQQAKLWISLVNGASLAYLQQSLGKQALVRAMPQIGFKYGHSVTWYAANGDCAQGDIALAERVFAAGGISRRIGESQMNAATAFSCEPGLLVQDLIADQKALDGEGLKVDAQALAYLLRGTASKIEELGIKGASASVATKGGSTEAAHRFAEGKGLYALREQRVSACVRKSEELSRKT